MVVKAGLATTTGWHLKAAAITSNTAATKLVKEIRAELLEKARPLLEKAISDIASRKVISLHTDISDVAGERIIVFTLENLPSRDNTEPLGW